MRPEILMGGDRDIIISPECMQRVAHCLGTEPLLFSDRGHSLMPEDGREAPAEKILAWLADSARAG